MVGWVVDGGGGGVRLRVRGRWMDKNRCLWQLLAAGKVTLIGGRESTYPLSTPPLSPIPQLPTLSPYSSVTKLPSLPPFEVLPSSSISSSHPSSSSSSIPSHGEAKVSHDLHRKFCSMVRLFTRHLFLFYLCCFFLSICFIRIFVF